MYNRKCIVTNTILPVEQLIRFVLLKNGTIVFQKNKKIQGRGAYCLNDANVIDQLFKKKLLNRSFKMNISNNIYEKLRKEVNEYVKK